MSPAVPGGYSERQVRCLEAMGLTAWVSRRAPSDAGPSAAVPAGEGRAGEGASPTAGESPAAPVRPVAAERSAPDGSVPPPPPRPEPVRPEPVRSEPVSPEPVSPGSVRSAPAAPATGRPLSARRVRPFERRGARVFETRPGEGRALVLVEPDPRAGDRPEADAPVASPLEGEAADLFRLMLRSIGLHPSDVSLALAARDDGEAPADAPAVRELLGGARRTVLWLSVDVAAGPVDTDGDAALRALGAAAFGVPHPALLLRDPVRKREAWAALKAARRRLDASPPGPAAGPAPGSAGGPGR